MKSKIYILILLNIVFISFVLAGNDLKSKIKNSRWKLSELSLNSTIQTLPIIADSLSSLTFGADNQIIINSGKRTINYTWDINSSGSYSTPQSLDHYHYYHS